MSFKLMKIAAQNIGIAKKGYYKKQDSKIEIKDDLDKAIEETIYVNEVEEVEEKVSEEYKVSHNIIKTDVISTALELKKNVNGEVMVLNFANATVVGGGYLNGAVAQEECICRSSLLYNCLHSLKIIYNINKKNYTPLHHDYLIYSPNVPVIRNSKYELLDNYEKISFISCPAVNKKLAKFFSKEDEVLAAMDSRIKFLIKFAVSKKPSVLILGAFGCGVFGNNREDIYPIFEKYINKYVPTNEMKVVFSDI